MILEPYDIKIIEKWKIFDKSERVSCYVDSEAYSTYDFWWEVLGSKGTWIGTYMRNSMNYFEGITGKFICIGKHIFIKERKPSFYA